MSCCLGTAARAGRGGQAPARHPGFGKRPASIEQGHPAPNTAAVLPYVPSAFPLCPPNPSPSRTPNFWSAEAGGAGLCASHSSPVIKAGVLGGGGISQRVLLASGQGSDNENICQGAQIRRILDTLKASPVLLVPGAGLGKVGAVWGRWGGGEGGRELGDTLTMSPQPLPQKCQSLSSTSLL